MFLPQVKLFLKSKEGLEQKQNISLFICYQLTTFHCLVVFTLWEIDCRNCRSSHPEVFLRKGFLKICSKFTGEDPCPSAISIKLICKFIEITLRRGYSPVNLLHIFRKPFLKNTSGWLLLKLVNMCIYCNCLLTRLSCHKFWN